MPTCQDFTTKSESLEDPVPQGTAAGRNLEEVEIREE